MKKLVFVIVFAAAVLICAHISSGKTGSSSFNSACAQERTGGTMQASVTAACSDYNSVGNEWSWTVEINGETVRGTQQMQIGAGDTITVFAAVEEYDDGKSDYGEESVSVTVEQSDIENGFEISFPVTVIENGGRYKGNKAVWNIRCTFD